ncbi:MAG: DUF445 domain-containing protein [Candidatus Izemoplasmataceae bacterium]|jgi:uncharacterized membrane protein YheB (UPF0754 family)|uniref:DUF445 domain-containing protein n=1 Tax=Liberiplasma polymorphum TaxID=3374570 RepID=UPI003773EC73
MENVIRLLTMIFIGGLIGYSTNKIAVKMLFRPINQKRFLFFKFQGLLPKRKSTIAKSMGEVIEQAFLSKDDIFDAFMNEETSREFKAVLKERLTQKISAIVPSMFRSMLGPNLDTMIKTFIDTEGDALIHELFDNIKNKGIEKLNIPMLVEEKVEAMDLITFEKLVLEIVSKELRHIELVGLFLGMAIGAVQFVIITFI